MTGQRTSTDRPEYPQYRERFGEDPARWLASDMDPTPRIRGITDLGVCNAWVQVAREMGVARHVRKDIERRRDYLVQQRQQIATDGGERDA